MANLMEVKSWSFARTVASGMRSSRLPAKPVNTAAPPQRTRRQPGYTAKQP